MSARMPLMLGLLACRAAPLPKQGLQPLVRRLKPGLKLGWIPSSMACEDLLVLCHNLVSMILDIPNGRFDLTRTEVKKRGDFVSVPSRLVVIENIVNGDS